MDVIFRSKLFFLHILFIFSQLSLNTVNASNTKELHTPDRHVYHFDIPNQSLAMGIIEFALQSKTTVVVTNEVLNNYPSVPVIGFYPTDKALAQLLANSPFDFSYIEKDNQFVVTGRKKDDEKSAKLTVNTEHNIEEVLVNASQLPLTYHSISSSLTHGNISSYDSARFINVFTLKLILDQSTEELNEILRNTSGITPADGLADSNNDYFVRGFPRNAVYIDGFRLEGNTGTKIHPSTIGAVEVLKGPSTLLFGQSEPGGVVNIVRKRPLKNAHYNLTTGVGSNEKTITSLDITDQFTTSLKDLKYRFIYVNEKQKKLRDVTNIDLELFSPSLSWSSDKTTLNILGEYQTKKQTREQGALVFAPAGQTLSLLSLNAPSNLARPDFSSTLNLTTIDISQTLTGTWALRSSYTEQKEHRLGVRASHNSLLASNAIISQDDLAPEQGFILFSGILIPIPQGTSINDDESQLFTVATLRSIFDERTVSRASFITANIEGSPELVGTTHHIRLGLDSLKRTVNSATVLEERSDITELSLNGSTATPQELINSIQTNSTTLGSLTEKSQKLELLDKGIYLQDNVEISTDITASLGARYTTINATQNTEDEIFKFPTFRELTTDLGVTYRFTNATTYFNYSESTKSNYIIDDFGSHQTKPESSHQTEIGIKLLNLENGLIATTSLYQIKKRNVTTVVFNDGQRQASFDNTQKSEGLDIEVNYQPTPNIGIISSVSLIKPQNTSGLYRGNLPPLTTQSTASLYANIELAKTKTTQLNISAGVFHIGDRYADQSNDIKLKNYQLVDLGLTYKFSFFDMKYTFRGGVKNVLDEHYMSSTEGSFRVNRGSGRTFINTLEIAF